MALPSSQTENETPKNNLSVCPEVMEPPKHPWRRFFARKVDAFCYIAMSCPLLFLAAIISGAMYYLVTGTGVFTPLAEMLLNGLFLSLILVQAITMESLLLRFWGTTPGKRLFGLKVRDVEGQKLTLSEAFKRTGCLYGLLYITGLIPIIALIIQYIQCRKLMNSGYTTWDRGNRNTVGL